jgi:presenilin-like A22 family membrane protease
MMKIAAAKERVREIFLAFDVIILQGGVLPYGFVYLNDIKFHLVKHIQHVILEIGISLVYLVYQEHYFSSDVNAWRSCHPYILLDIAYILFESPNCCH